MAALIAAFFHNLHMINNFNRFNIDFNNFEKSSYKSKRAYISSAFYRKFESNQTTSIYIFKRK